MAKIEICAYSLDDCVVAQSSGAYRIELCGGMLEGGTTPSAGLVTLARAALQIELFVMIRPRGGDFCYTESELSVMEKDIEIIKKLGADGIVLGLLLPNGKVDVEITRRLVNLAHPMQVTFHRAFDMTADPFQALEDIISTGCVRILTSGQRDKAVDGVALLTDLVKAANGRIEIMAGSGVNSQNAGILLKTGVQALHLTGKSTKESLMRFRNPNVSMGGAVAPSEYELSFSDARKIIEIREVIDAWQAIH